MRLRPVPYSDGITKSVQIKFGGLNRGIGAADGELADMRNLTSDHYPVLASRARRGQLDLVGYYGPGGSGSPAPDVTALYAHEKLCWVDGTGFYYDGVKKGNVSRGDKALVSLGVYIVIFPDKVYYDTLDDVFGKLESVWSGNRLTFSDGLLYGEDADANTLSATGVVWSDYFKVGDAVSIEGVTQFPENNKTAVIREIDGDKLRFSEWVFRLDSATLTETGSLTVGRKVPDLLFMCENENRIWGCDGTTIYTSVPGDIFNFNVFDGTDMDAWAWDVGSPGPFTACVSFLGFPMFFKEEVIYQVYGTLPSNFQVVSSATMGVAQGCERSLAISNETLYYLSRSGVVAYAGGIPQPIGMAFATERFGDAAAGGDGLKYYISMRKLGTDDDWKLYVFDSLRNMWHIEDDTHATHFVFWRGNLYFLKKSGEIWCMMLRGAEAPEHMATEPAVGWSAEFADIADMSPNRTGIVKLQVRVRLEPGASGDIYLKFDAEDEWRRVHGAIEPKVKRSYYLPIVPRRVDHFRLRLVGTGGCEIYSLVRERYVGSELVNVPGNIGG